MNNRFEKFFGEFKLVWVPATKNSNYGRGIGGSLYGFKINLKKADIIVEFEKVRNVDVLKVSTTISTFYIIPVYLRGITWIEDFEKIKFLVNDWDLKNVVIIGDLNIRIGEEQQWDDFNSNILRERRCSKDKILNKKGKIFLDFCTDYGLTILNGRTPGDEQGEFTYISTLGNSVNDICCISPEMIHHLNDFEVNYKIWSDHMPIILKLKVKKDPKEKNIKLLPKLNWKEENRSKYLTKLEKNTKELIEYSQSNMSLISIKDLTNVIKVSADEIKLNTCFKPQQKWFNVSCHFARRNSFKLLNKWRKTNNANDHSNYLISNALFKKLCQETRQTYIRNLEMQLNNIKKAEDWWKMARNLRNSNLTKGTGLNANEFKVYFENLLNPPLTASSIQYAKPNYADPELDGCISSQEIKTVLEKVKLNKAPGEDRIPYEHFINAHDSFLQLLARTYSNMLNDGNVEECFLKTLVFPIHKKGDVNEVQNYRGISFMETCVKILMGVLLSRLEKFERKNKILNEFQAGFRRGYSTVDNIYNLISIVNLKFHENKKVYAFFVDFKAAFDCIPRMSLLYKLSTMGISSKFLNLIQSLYTNTKAAVWDGEELSEYFSTAMGVKQGCLLSPLLFALFLNDLHEFLGGGLTINNFIIRLLMYADDIIILAEDRATLQKMINKLEEYCNLWNLQVNLSKSKIMVFRKAGKLSKDDQFFFNSEIIEIVNVFTYLGMKFTPGLAITEHLKERECKAKNSINATWSNFVGKKNISFSCKFALFNAVMRSIFSYAAQVWGFQGFEAVDKLQRYFIKRIFKLPTFTPNYILELETGILEMHLYTLKLHMNYVIKTLFSYTTDRLPHILSREVINRKIFWYKDWCLRFRNENFSWENAHLDEATWKDNMLTTLEILRNNHLNKNYESARRSQHGLYASLNYSQIQTYINDGFSARKVSWIFKIRAGLIGLNANRYREGVRRQCSLCNLQEEEDLFHFLGRCPVLKEVRFCNFQKTILNQNEAISVLNGDNDESWNKLYNFTTTAFTYRMNLISEFNT
jgi:hypothetical protein